MIKDHQKRKMGINFCAPDDVKLEFHMIGLFWPKQTIQVKKKPEQIILFTMNFE